MRGVEYHQPLGAQMARELASRGVLVLMSGNDPAIQRVMPTLGISAEQVDEVLGAFEDSLAAILEAKGSTPRERRRRGLVEAAAGRPGAPAPGSSAAPPPRPAGSGVLQRAAGLAGRGLAGQRGLLRAAAVLAGRRGALGGATRGRAAGAGGGGGGGAAADPPSRGGAPSPGRGGACRGRTP